MTEPAQIFTLFGVDGYSFGLCVAIAVLLATGLLCLLWKNRGHSPAMGLRFTLYAIPLTLLFARLGYVAVRLRFLAVDYVPGFWYRLPLGGYSLAGGFVGLMLAGWLFARISGQCTAKVLDLAAPAALLVLACIRLAEAFTLDGVGLYVENEALWHFPFAVANPYGEYVLPVFFYEAVVAALLCLVALRSLRSGRLQTGDVARTATLLLGLTQILLESLRADDYLRFGFVRVNQLWGALLAGYVLAVWLRRFQTTRARRGITVTVYLLCIGVMIAVEFGRDKSTIPNEILYAAMALALLVIGIISVALRNARTRGSQV